MRTTQFVNINYKVKYIDKIGNNITEKTAYAVLVKLPNETKWINFLNSPEFFDISPKTLIGLLKKSEISSVELYQGNYYVVNAFVENISDFAYVRIIATFNKTSGWPVSYSLVGVGNNSGFLVTYSK